MNFNMPVYMIAFMIIASSCLFSAIYSYFAITIIKKHFKVKGDVDKTTHRAMIFQISSLLSILIFLILFSLEYLITAIAFLIAVLFIYYYRSLEIVNYNKRKTHTLKAKEEDYIKDFDDLTYGDVYRVVCNRMGFSTKNDISDYRPTGHYSIKIWFSDGSEQEYKLIE